MERVASGRQLKLLRPPSELHRTITRTGNLPSRKCSGLNEKEISFQCESGGTSLFLPTFFVLPDKPAEVRQHRKHDRNQATHQLARKLKLGNEAELQFKTQQRLFRLSGFFCSHKTYRKVSPPPRVRRAAIPSTSLEAARKNARFRLVLSPLRSGRLPAVGRELGPLSRALMACVSSAPPTSQI